MFGTYLSHRKSVKSVLLFILSLSFSGQNGFRLLYSAVLSASPARCHWLGETHLSPPRRLFRDKQLQAEAELCRHSHHTCTAAQRPMFCFLRKILLTPPLQNFMLKVHIFTSGFLQSESVVLISLSSTRGHQNHQKVKVSHSCFKD